MAIQQEKDLMLKFLKKNYPIYRLKHGKHFKRTMVLEKASYLMSKKEEFNKLYTELFNVLLIVFDSDKTSTEEVLKGFLNMRPTLQGRV